MNFFFFLISQACSIGCKHAHSSISCKFHNSLCCNSGLCGSEIVYFHWLMHPARPVTKLTRGPFHHAGSTNSKSVNPDL